eukprot:CAMPEP_0196167338 /NCGR_PEP_ID=MMETSP0911-20130528/2520_1 /TAXON_ID=49265 /ORGANISM="Thalassiosira rotula, Strain GSO102" /LENGTH=73 /DNA_ID=CAMNT_0041433129 /DNA_START=479 /DNA_END=700 /DNA_ORIENTATION=+
MHWDKHPSKAGSFFVPFNDGSTSLANAGVLERKVRQAAEVVERKVLRLIMGCAVDDDDDSGVRVRGWVDLGEE